VLTERLDAWISSDSEVVAADCAEENVDGGCDGSPSPPHNASHETSIAGASDSGSSHASGAAAIDESAIVRARCTARGERPGLAALGTRQLG